jgi:RNA polymerase sigma factor (sigma-70 family)
MSEKERQEPKTLASMRIEWMLSFLLKDKVNALTRVSKTQWDTFYRLQNQHLARCIARLRLPPERVEDVLQEVWKATLARWDSFREPEGARRLLAWTRRVAYNKAVDLVRRLNRRRATSLDTPLIELVDTKVVRTAESARNSEVLETLLEILRCEQSMNWWLVCEHHLKDRSAKELAKETGLTEHAIHNRLNRALNRLRSLAERMGFGGEPMP